jgi:hypothetical protein
MRGGSASAAAAASNEAIFLGLKVAAVRIRLEETEAVGESVRFDMVLINMQWHAPIEGRDRPVYVTRRISDCEDVVPVMDGI